MAHVRINLGAGEITLQMPEPIPPEDMRAHLYRLVDTAIGALDEPLVGGDDAAKQETTYRLDRAKREITLTLLSKPRPGGPALWRLLDEAIAELETPVTAEPAQ